MTTEADFQAALDADPTDWQTRLVFADWLLDRGDMRWEGMRWLGMARKWPWSGSRCHWFDMNWNKEIEVNSQKEHRDRLERAHLPIIRQTMRRLGLFLPFSTRAEAENAFCRAYPALATAHPAEFAMGVMA